MIKLYDEHTALRRPPKNLIEADLALFSHEFYKNIPETNIQVLQNVDILNDSIFNPGKLHFYPTHTSIDGLSHQKLRKYKLYFKKHDRLKKGVWIIDNWSSNYFHWLTDAIPRLIVSSQFIKEHKVILPQSYQTLNFVIQSLELLGFKAEYYKNYKRLNVKELLLPSHTHPSGNFNKRILNITREKFIGNMKATTPWRKVYISRQKANQRKINNEKDVIHLLKQYNFEIHNFEDYDFKKQIEIMNQASHVAGLHGAGFANMLFMNSGSKVLELRNARDCHNNCYFTLASDLGNDYYYLLNKSESTDFHNGNVSVDILELERIVGDMIV